MTQHTKKNEKGFSILEIIIVIAIIGTLMGIIISRISGGTDNAKAGITDTKAYSLQSKLIQYQLANGRFPKTEEGLEALTAGPGVPIANSEDLKDGWGQAFDYRLKDEGPLIISMGKNHSQGNPNEWLCYLNGKKVKDCEKLLDSGESAN